ncbi:MAG: hypothetical protein GY699_14270, partial [Desulfobacteraceae bacterium]|nr:hypothetical protein [Desulfobacteraceae bacterium]
MMIKRIINILKTIVLLWIILFVVISSHPECRSVISDVCHEKKLSFTIKQVSILPANILALNSMTSCREGVCCEENQCKDDKEFLISGQYPKLFKQAWGNENKLILPNENTKKISDDSYQNKIP